MDWLRKLPNSWYKNHSCQMNWFANKDPVWHSAAETVPLTAVRWQMRSRTPWQKIQPRIWKRAARRPVDTFSCQLHSTAIISKTPFETKLDHSSHSYYNDLHIPPYSPQNEFRSNQLANVTKALGLCISVHLTLIKTANLFFISPTRGKPNKPQAIFL